MDQEKALFQRRIRDLAARSYEQNIYTFTDFLTMDQQALALDLEKELAFAGMTFSGGSEDCERRVLRFGSPKAMGYSQDFPICCVIIEPLAEKFAEDLSHRDYLGALMHLGVKREVLGDIIVKGKRAYLFCLDHMADLLIEELDKVRHTNVRCRRAQELPDEVRPELEQHDLIVSSLRCDGLVAKIYHISRSSSLELFREKKIFLNGRTLENNSAVLKSGDTISVRGYGKFLFQGECRETKKGNLKVKISLYV